MTLPGGPGLTIRAAAPDDAALIHALILEIAEYEKLRHEVVATVELIREALFPEHGLPTAHALIGEVDGAPQGYALYFFNFSTFMGRAGLYLEDVFVRPAFRGRGLGKALLIALAEIARRRNCARMEWSVLDWNTSAIDFYKSLGARPMDGWTVFRLEEPAIHSLADQARPGPA
jgi:GNAT superfamily N-acetyltransferase